MEIEKIIKSSEDYKTTLLKGLDKLRDNISLKERAKDLLSDGSRFIWLTNLHPDIKHLANSAEFANKTAEEIKTYSSKDLINQSVLVSEVVQERSSKKTFESDVEGLRVVVEKALEILEKFIEELKTPEPEIIIEMNRRYGKVVKLYLDSGNLRYKGVAEYSSNDEFLEAIQPLLGTAEGDMFETILEIGTFPEVRSKIEETCFEYALDWWESGE